MKNLFFILLLTNTQSVFSQGEANIWYFGHTGYAAGLDFNSGKPVALSNGKLEQWYCGSVMSTSKGRLLFYTNGVQVWDSTHAIIPNGSGLKGDVLSAQSALIIPNPGHSNTFYIFTTPKLASSNGFMYSELDMNLNSGKGDIVSGKKNIQLVAPVCEKIAAVRHANGKDYWVVTHKWNTDTIYTYLITSAGINRSPVKSTTGLTIKGNTDNAKGQMKISPDGKKIAFLNYLNLPSILADFNTSNGKISNVWQFSGFELFGLEFSRNSNYMYVTYTDSYWKTRLYQYFVNTNSKSTFLASQTTFPDNSLSLSSEVGMQLAPDGKIYYANSGGRTHLGVINAPDSAGKACRLQEDYIYLEGKRCYRGLPGFVSSYLGRDFSVSTNCFNDSANFKISNTNQIDSVLWNFGDTISGKNNFSKKKDNVFHVYSKPGNYTPTLTIYYNNTIDISYHTFHVNKYILSIGKDTTICNNFKLNLSPKTDYLSYKWNTGSSSKTINVTAKGTYYLDVIDSSGCINSDTIKIKNPFFSANFSISDSIQCFKNDSIEFKETYTSKDDRQKQATFYFYDGSSKDTIIKRTFPTKGKYNILLIAKSQEGCIDSKTKTINAGEGIPVSLGKDTIICNNFKLYLSPQMDFANYKWNSGNSSKKIEVNTKGTYYLTVSDSLGCVSLDTIRIKNPIILADFSISDSIQCYKNNLFEFKETTSYKNDSRKQSIFYFFDGNTKDTLVKKSFVSEGKYTIMLVAESKEGCIDSKIKSVEVRPKSITNFMTADVCETDSVTFINQSLYAETYNWKFGDGEYSTKISPKHFYKINGISQTFNVTLVSLLSGGCSDSTGDVVTINANPISDFTYSLSGLKIDLQATQANNTKYRWKFGKSDSAVTSNTNYTHTYTDFPNPNTVCLEVTNAAVCYTETCKQIVTTSISNTKPKGFKIYPNPNIGNFTIEIDNPEKDVSIDVYNAIGERVKRVERVGKISNINLNVAAGIYLVKVNNGEVVYNQKVSIVK